MSLSVEPHPSSTQLASPFEQVLLAGVPNAKHAELVPLLRSSDRAVRAMALVLIQLDREDAARHGPHGQPQQVPRAKHAELQPLLHSPDRTVRQVARLLLQLDREEAARRTARRRLQGVAQGW